MEETSIRYFGFWLVFKFSYRGIHEMGLGDVSQLLVTLYTQFMYLSLCTQTAKTTSPETFSQIPLYVKCNVKAKNWSVLGTKMEHAQNDY